MRYYKAHIEDNSQKIDSSDYTRTAEFYVPKHAKHRRLAMLILLRDARDKICIAHIQGTQPRKRGDFSPS